MNIYDFTVLMRENGADKQVSLKDYEGKVILVVNTATACGLTPQYEALEALYRKYEDAGFVILDFPCNQFKEQAKESDEQINSFCQLRYDTTFPRFKKIEVNGENEAPLYTYLKAAAPKAQSKGGIFMKMAIKAASKANGKSTKDSDIKWNFEKFLIDRQGNVVGRFEPTTTPQKLEKSVAELI